jgi:uncharacterized protein YndB with AHSA1/START domain
LPVTSVTKDADALTMTLSARFAAPIERVWELWSDPRRLERWWGPPGFPATVIEHDLRPGGTVTYLTTGPDGGEAKGWWRMRAVDPPRHLIFEDGFADAAGEPDPGLPTTTVEVTLGASTDGATDMQILWRFPTPEAMEQMIAMGFEAGLTDAVGQIDALLDPHP